MRSPKARVLIYVGLVIAVTIASRFLVPRMANSPFASLLIMWTPGIAALLATLLTWRSFKEFGWKPWPVKWLAIGWLLPMLYAFPAYGLVWLTGIAAVPSSTFIERARMILNMPTQPVWLLIVAAFGFITIVNLLPNVVFALGEELGWRGFLVPELTKWIGFRSASILSGVIWAAWHMPGVWSGAYGDTGTPRLYRVACFTAMVIATAVALAWLRMKSGSIWPVAIAHAVHNGVIQAFFDAITQKNSRTPWVIGEFGIALVPFTIALAWYCWSKSRGLQDARVKGNVVQMPREMVVRNAS